MSTLAVVRNAILTRFIGTFGSTLTAMDNHPFDPPEPGPGVKWYRVNVRFAGGRQDSFGAITGARKFVKQGVLIIQVFTPLGTATNANDALCQQIQDLYEGIRIGDLWFMNGGVSFSGADGEWFQQNVVFDFNFEDNK